MLEIDLSFVPESVSRITSDIIPVAQDGLKALRQGTCRGSEWTGWFDFPKKHGFALGKDIQSYVKGLDVDYDLVLVIGIGGSYLGARAVTDALSHTFSLALKGGKPDVVYAGQDLSPGALVEILELLDHRKPIVNVISKSGTTTEPAVAFRIIYEHLRKRYSKTELSKRIVATTNPKGGALRQLANDNKYKIFQVPDDVGGRYSVLTAVGLLPLALAGLNIEKMLNGANQIFSSLNENKRNAVLDYAATRMACYRSGKVIEVMAISEPKLKTFAGWWQQLFGESEGKQGKGIFPASVVYTTDLHSLGQLLQDGMRNLLETFVIFDDKSPLSIPKTDHNLDELDYLAGKTIAQINDAAILGTKIAHFDGGVPCLSIKAGPVSEEAFGELFAFFETACAVSAHILEVNPFDQPGVEDYKRNLFALMGKPGFEQLAAKLLERMS